MQIDCLHKHKTLCISPSQSFFCSMWFSQETAIFALHSIFWLVLLMETDSVYCETGVDLYGCTHCYDVFHWQIWNSHQTDPPIRLQTLSADAIKLLQVQAPESHPTYLLPPSHQPIQNKCFCKQSPIYSHMVSLSQTQWCHQCTCMAKGTKRLWLGFYTTFRP